MHSLVQTDNVILQASTTSSDHNINTKMFSKRLAHLRCLKSQFSRRDQDQGLDLAVLRVDAFESGDDESGSLSGTVLCAGKYISAGTFNPDLQLPSAWDDSLKGVMVSAELQKILNRLCCKVVVRCSRHAEHRAVNSRLGTRRTNHESSPIVGWQSSDQAEVRRAPSC
ncbi:hypothetical protein KCV07_g203, partial [Aureobasidium melanogenum]